jgi:hypothetical protein
MIYEESGLEGFNSFLQIWWIKIELGQILWDFNCNNKYCTNNNSKGHTIETCWVKKKDVLKNLCSYNGRNGGLTCEELSNTNEESMHICVIHCNCAYWHNMFTHPVTIGNISLPSQWATFSFLGLTAHHHCLHMNSLHVFEASCL